MKVREKIDKVIEKVVNAVTNSSVAQEENSAAGEKKVFANCLRCALPLRRRRRCS